jgi:protein TonB
MSGQLHWRRILPAVFGLLFISSVGIGAAVLIGHFMDGEPVKVERKIQNITLLAPPPPPPPVEKPPEPEVQQEKVEIPEPEVPQDLPDQPSDEPPAQDLGLDAEGGAGSDSFGLVGRKGGRGLLGGAGSPEARFAGQVQKEIQQALYRDDSLRQQAYSIVLKVWVAFDGTIQRTDLDGSTGFRNVDDRIASAIADLPKLADAPPPDMPMPIRLRITARL